jgi:hypothetical protein
MLISSASKFLYTRSHSENMNKSTVNDSGRNKDIIINFIHSMKIHYNDMLGYNNMYRPTIILNACRKS